MSDQQRAWEDWLGQHHWYKRGTRSAFNAGWDRSAAVERERIATALTKQAIIRFDVHGPHDARGAAFWDAATGLVETRLARQEPRA